MFDFLNRGSELVERERIDRNLIHERLAQALRDAGLDPDGRPYMSLMKMISDDLDWYFENLDEQDV